MKCVIKYQDTSGNLHDTEGECLHADRILQAKEIFDPENFFGWAFDHRGCGGVYKEYLPEFLIVNEDKILELLNAK